MKLFPGLRRFFRLQAFDPDPEGDLEKEFEFHFRLTEEELLAQGMTPERAREETRRRFGDEEVYRQKISRLDHQKAANSRRSARLEAFAQDLSHVVRGIGRTPGFTLAVVLTLALGIGANATMFGVVDRLLLSPPAHVVDADDVFRIQVARISPFTGLPAIMGTMSFSDYRDYLPAGGFESVATFGDEDLVLGEGEGAVRVNGLFSSASFFPLLGVTPALGRFFDESEAAAGATGVVVLSHALWVRQFGGDRSVLGRTVPIGDGVFTIIGVAPKGFNGVQLSPVDLYLPIHAYSVMEGSDEWVDHRGYWWLRGVVRLSENTSLEAATAEATALHRNGHRERIEEGRYPAEAEVVLGPLNDALGPNAPGEIQVARWLVGVTVIVLLIACANVANLLLARGARRRRELGIRVALGISRRRLISQLLLESMVLAVLGGLVGLILAYWGGHLMRAVFLPNISWPSSPVDGRVLLFTAVVAGATGLLSGAAPAFRGTGGGIVGALRDGGRGGTDRHSRGQAALLVFQAALSVVLLIGAGLFVRSLDHAKAVDLGLDPESVIVAELDLVGDWDAEARLELAGRAVSRIGTMPGVAVASHASAIPFWSMSAFNLFVPGLDSLPVGPTQGPFVTAGSPDHLTTLGIELREGRFFTQEEASSGARVALVSENMAEGLWDNGSAIGQCFTLVTRENPCWEVVGVVEASHLDELALNSVPWQYFLPFGEPVLAKGMGPRGIFVRAEGDVSPLLAPIQAELRGLDPGIRFATVSPLQDRVDPGLRAWVLGATMFSLFGGLALVVAMVGLYSALAFNVARRTRELGVRSAMGASRTRLLSMVLRQALAVTGIGISLGLVVAMIGSQRLGPLLFETSPREPLVIVGVVVTLLVVAVVAGAVPAWVASRVDPMGALRSE